MVPLLQNSNNVANDIRRLTKKYKDVNERQDALKLLLHNLDIDTFGIKFKKQNIPQRKRGKYKTNELKTLSQIVKERHKELSQDINKIRKLQSLNAQIWEMGRIVKGPKHKPAERTTILEPTTGALLTDEQQIREATLKYNVKILTKNKVQEQNIESVREKQNAHDKIMIEEKEKNTWNP